MKKKNEYVLNMEKGKMMEHKISTAASNELSPFTESFHPLDVVARTTEFFLNVPIIYL